MAASPWHAVTPLEEAAFSELRRRAIFDCGKWDTQVGDECVLARHPLVIKESAWTEIASAASALDREMVAAEAELAARPELHAALGLPIRLRRALRRTAGAVIPPGAPRLTRFDFHFTTDGWRISEANSDVPGGLNEAALAPIIQAQFTWARTLGDPADAYADAISKRNPSSTVAMIHATAYSDDHQVVRFLGHRLAARGATVRWASPSQLRWSNGLARLPGADGDQRVDAVVRFFPCEWLERLPSSCEWPMLLTGGETVVSNPGTAILTQSKRFPLVWDSLRTPMPTWRALLPETRDPRSLPRQGSDDWVIKPALGRIGEGVGLPNVTEHSQMRRIRRDAHRQPTGWVAQRRFDILPIDVGKQQWFPCLGVYTVNGIIAGAYGRLARRALIDKHALDAAVLTA